MTVFILVALAMTLLVLFGAAGVAPTYPSRLSPGQSSGQDRHLEDGFVALVSFGADPDIELWEMSVKPPGVQGGEFIPQTTMWNEVFRTFKPRSLKTIPDMTFKFAYDPACRDSIDALVNEETNVGIAFSNDDTWALWGALRDVDFDEMVEGTMPTGTATVGFTNVDPNTGEEEGPVFVDTSGT